MEQTLGKRVMRPGRTRDYTPCLILRDNKNNAKYPSQGVSKSDPFFCFCDRGEERRAAGTKSPWFQFDLLIIPALGAGWGGGGFWLILIQTNSQLGRTHGNNHR